MVGLKAFGCGLSFLSMLGISVPALGDEEGRYYTARDEFRSDIPEGRGEIVITSDTPDAVVVLYEGDGPLETRKKTQLGKVPVTLKGPDGEWRGLAIGVPKKDALATSEQFKSRVRRHVNMALKDYPSVSGRPEPGPADEWSSYQRARAQYDEDFWFNVTMTSLLSVSSVATAYIGYKGLTDPEVSYGAPKSKCGTSLPCEYRRNYKPFAWAALVGGTTLGVLTAWKAWGVLRPPTPPQVGVSVGEGGAVALTWGRSW